MLCHVYLHPVLLYHSLGAIYQHTPMASKKAAVAVGVLALQTNSVKRDMFGSSQMAGREARREDELEAAEAPDEAMKPWKGAVGRHRC